MATADRDYYELLGISRDADDAAIKKAFRRLARQLHPDVSDDPEADVRFREVPEAYEVLSNAETRSLYDRFGHSGLRSGGFRPTHTDFGGLSDLFAAFFVDDVLARHLGVSRPFVRVGDELEESGLHSLAMVGATYGYANRSLGAVSLVGPLRMDYEKALRTVRSAAYELSRFVEEVYAGE